MALTALYEGTSSISATWSCSTSTAGPDADTNQGIYQVFLDVSDMINGDTLQIQVWEKTRSGDTQRLVYQSILSNAQSEPIWVSPSLILMYGWDVTVATLAGTTITVAWSIRRVS